MNLDPIDYAILSQAMLAAAREMGAKLVRSAYSTIVREARDASTAILDREGNIIAQSEMIPIQLGSMGTTLRACLERYPTDSLAEGDFLVNNHPYYGGQHLQDVFIFTPVFHEGEFIAFSGSTAHHLDLGGGSAGLNNSATDLFQEGLILPPSKWNLEKDWFGGNFERLLTANIRVPHQTLGDFNAQFAANAIGAQRIKQLCDKYGRSKLLSAMSDVISYSERHLRAAISAIPDGVYTASDAMDDDGYTGSPIFVRVKLTVRGHTLEVDFDGTDPQSKRNINAPFASTVSAVMCCIKAALIGSDVPFNEGSFRPVFVKAPLGSLLNPSAPAPVRARMEPCYRAFSAVMKALAKALPEKTIAAGFDASLMACLSRFSDGRYRVCLESYGGGYGAGIANDGAHAVSSPLSNTTNSPIEALDMEYSFFRVVEYSLAADSFGHGKHRGGLGMRRVYEVLEDFTDFSIYADRFSIRPQGTRGGANAALARCEIWRNGVRLEVDARRGVVVMKGDRVVVVTSGGAGWGIAAERSRVSLDNDIEDGFISSEDALKIYPQLRAGMREAS